MIRGSETSHQTNSNRKGRVGVQVLDQPTQAASDRSVLPFTHRKVQKEIKRSKQDARDKARERNQNHSGASGNP